MPMFNKLATKDTSVKKIRPFFICMGAFHLTHNQVSLRIHGHISYILEANSKRPIKDKKELENEVKLC